MTIRAALFPILLAAAPGARAATPAPAETRLQALRIERQLDVIGRVIDEKRERVLLETTASAGVAAVFSRWIPGGSVSLFSTRAAPQPPGSPQEIAAAKAAMAPWEKLRKETRALELQQALLADQLQRYKETGELAPTPPAAVAGIKRLLDRSWGILPPSEPEAPFLRGGLIDLQEQLRMTAARTPAAARPAPPRPAAQNLPAPEIRLTPAASFATIRPRFERDAGTGRPENDPLPDLIVLLSSAEPRGRALAADELGSLGVRAASAVPDLRRKLSDPDRRVRASAAQALGAIGGTDAGVLGDLRRVLLDPNEEVRLNARASLQRLELAFPRGPFPALVPR